MLKKWQEYSDSLPEKLGVTCVRNYISAKLAEMRKQQESNSYTKLACLKIVSSLMSVADQKLIDSFIQDSTHSSEMSKLAVKSLRIRVQNIAQVLFRSDSSEINDCFRRKAKNPKKNLLPSIQRRKKANIIIIWHFASRILRTKNR